MLEDREIDTFRSSVYDYYYEFSRDDLPWRLDISPYNILVSEIMLQQTQVIRAREKYMQFMALFPTIDALASASLQDVLSAWSGLGYNRRAKYLHTAAQVIVRDYSGVVPATIDELVKLPGIGPNTAGAIMVYAHNYPAVFIETNIKTVIIHHFFSDRIEPGSISDTDILKYAGLTLDMAQPRIWYWALMDYGSYLKKQIKGGYLGLSKSYKKQSTFRGSLREMRGMIIRSLLDGQIGRYELENLSVDGRFRPALESLIRDGLVADCNGQLSLTDSQPNKHNTKT